MRILGTGLGFGGGLTGQVEGFRVGGRLTLGRRLLGLGGRAPGTGRLLLERVNAWAGEQCQRQRHANGQSVPHLNQPRSAKLFILPLRKNAGSPL